MLLYNLVAIKFKALLIRFQSFDPFESCPSFNKVITNVVKILFRSVDGAIEKWTYCKINTKFT